MANRSYRLYPLASASGKAIPLDIIKPSEHIAFPISSTPFVAPEQFTLKVIEEHCIVLFSDVDTVISFDDTTSISNFFTGDLFIPANTIAQSVFPTQYISAISQATGTLHINVIELWDSLITEVQNQYG
jgi:hypothetical protein